MIIFFNPAESESRRDPIFANNTQIRSILGDGVLSGSGILRHPRLKAVIFGLDLFANFFVIDVFSKG